MIPLLWSGAGAYVTRLCELQSSSRQVRIVTASASSGERDWPVFRSRLRHAGVEHIRVDLFRRAPDVFWPAVEQLRSLIGEWRPGIVHVHSGVPACAVAIALAGSRRRPAFVAQFQNWRPGRPAWMDTMDGWGFSRSDMVIVGATASERVLRERGVDRRKIRRLRLGVEMPTWADHRVSVRPPVIGFVGRIEPRKAQIDLLLAFEQVVRQRPQMRLQLVGPDGDAAYARRLDQEISGRGLAGVVERTGYVRDVGPFLRRWRLFVSTSVDEGQGLAVVEAMAHGTPVVARRAPGVEDTLRHGTRGVLVEGREPRPIAEAMLAVLDEEARWTRLSLSGRRWAQRSHAWPRCIDRIDALYHQAQAASTTPGRT